MTSKDELPSVTILCEDIDQHTFIRQYLICRGWESHQIKTLGNFKGIKTNNNAFVVNNYPKLVESYRRNQYKNIAVVVMIDGDGNTYEDKMRSFNIALDATRGNLNQELRYPDEKIAIFVPARNIESWFYYINNYEQNLQFDDEITDYKITMSLKDRIKLAKNSAKILAQKICPRGIDQITLSSLRHGCQELQRLYE